MKQSTRNRLYDIQIKKCCDLANYIHNNPDISNEELTKRWKEIFFLITKLMGFNKESRWMLWNELVSYGWIHFLPTTTERTWDRDRWLYEFEGDLSYYSDLMYFNALIKLHWEFRCILKKW